MIYKIIKWNIENQISLVLTRCVKNEITETSKYYTSRSYKDDFNIVH